MAEDQTDQADLISNAPAYSVSEISGELKRVVEDTFGHVRIRGEISRFTRAASGHCYWTLKDDKAVLDSVMWKSAAGRLAFKPEEGLEVICTGRVSTYPGRSKYQIIVDRMEPAGEGALMAMLEARKKALAAEGLFDDERKQPIPKLPEVIGVVTSPTGAVIRDILHRLADRFPRHVLLWPVQVQGETAAGQVAKAIEGFNALPEDGSTPRPDLLIVARGGGSLEDLWAFNEEVVVRAAAASQIPLISAVGHETDTTLIDYASDRRAPTPTAAAEMAVPVRADLLSDLESSGARLTHALTRRTREACTQLDGLARGLPRLKDLLDMPRQRLDHIGSGLPRALQRNLNDHGNRLSALSARHRPTALQALIKSGGDRVSRAGAALPRSINRNLKRDSDRLAQLGKLLDSYSYERVLDRGFALVTGPGKSLVRNVGEAAKAGDVTLRFSDGEIAAHVGDIAPGGQMRRPRRKAKKPADDDGQGSLL